VLALVRAGDDDEREVHDDVGARAQALHRRAIEDVALAVLDLPPAVLGRVQRPACHADDAVDSRDGPARRRRLAISPVGPVTAT